MMQLSAELFKEIVGHLKSSAPASDRRDGPRVGLRNRVNLTLLNRGSSAPARTFEVGVKDLSTTGIAVLHHTPLPDDTVFAICLPTSKMRKLTAVYQVRHCHQLEKDLFRVGAMLIKVDDPAPVPAASAPAAAPAAAPADAKPAAPPDEKKAPVAVMAGK